MNATAGALVERRARAVVSVVVAMLAVAAAVGAGAVLADQTAEAASTGAFSLEPLSLGGPVRSVFEYSLRPGQVVTDTAVLRNLTPAAETFTVYAADAYDTRVGDQFALRAAGQRNVGVGAWISLPSARFTVAAYGTALVPFRLAVPADASPGDRAGGIVALDQAAHSVRRGSLRVLVHSGAGVRIFLRVAGALVPGLAVGRLRLAVSIPAFSFLDGSSRAVVRLPLSDTGDTRLDVTISERARDSFGRTVKRYAPVHMELLPGSHVSVTEPAWSSLPIFGPDIHVDAQVDARGVGVSFRRTRAVAATFLDVPWVLIGVVVGVLLVVAAGAMVKWRSRRRRGRGQVDPSAHHSVPVTGEPWPPVATGLTAGLGNGRGS